MRRPSACSHRSTRRRRQSSPRSASSYLWSVSERARMGVEQVLEITGARPRREARTELQGSRTSLGELRDYSRMLKKRHATMSGRMRCAPAATETRLPPASTTCRTRGCPRYSAPLIATYQRGLRYAMAGRVLLRLLTFRRFTAAVKLVFGGDLAALRDHARMLVAQDLGRDDAEDAHRTPVALEVDPWPADIPLVSVVVVCFNYGAYVEEAIASVLAQTAADHCEVLVVDGGSDDPETIAKMQRLADDPPPRTTVLLRTDGRHLVGDNRNYGIERARGRYIACLDADDRLDPRYLEVALYLLERRGYDLVSTATRSFGLADDYFGLKLSWTCVTCCAPTKSPPPLSTGANFGNGGWFPRRRDRRRLCLRGLEAVGPHRCSGRPDANIQAPLFDYRVHSTDSLSRQGGGVRDMAAHRKAVRAFNEDVVTPDALAESVRRRDLEITVEGAFDNLRDVDSAHRPTILIGVALHGRWRRRKAAQLHRNVSGECGLQDWWSSRLSASTRSSGTLRPGSKPPPRRSITCRNSCAAATGPTTSSTSCRSMTSTSFLSPAASSRYHQLPKLRRQHPDLRVADLLFNAQGHVQNNRRYADQIDLHLCENLEVRDWLVAHGQDEASVVVIESGVDISLHRPVERRAGCRYVSGSAVGSPRRKRLCVRRSRANAFGLAVSFP